MNTRKLFFMICAIVLVPAFTWAEEIPVPVPQDPVGENQSGLTVPATLTKAQAMIEAEVAKKNALETQNEKIVSEETGSVEYNDDGTINNVTYPDGTVVGYSYERDGNGDLVRCDLTSPDGGMTFTRDSENGGIKIEVYGKIPPSKGNVPAAGIPPGPFQEAPVTVKYPAGAIDLDKVARTPVKFDLEEINKSVNKASKMKDDAAKEYKDNTAPYYTEVAKRLNDNSAELAKEGVQIKALVEVIQKKDASDTEVRKAVDESVQYIRSRTGGRIGADDEFLRFENGLRYEILDPAKEVYDAKVDVALKYVDRMIDKLLQSRLALYMNSKNEKIDVVINLPKLSEETPKEKK